jgi:hypothetical protein
MITHYEVLGIKENATSKEIRKAYKKLVLCLHPDKNVGVNEIVRRLVEEGFLEVQEAYATLSDRARRQEYDAALAAVRSEGEYYVPPPKAAPPPVERKEPERCDRCQTILGEPMHRICEGCLNEIAALEKEVKERRRLGVTACKLCGTSNSPLDKSPLSGVCLKCWGNIANEVTRRQLGVAVCRLCGASKRPLDKSPLSGVCLKCWGNIANEVTRRQLGVAVCRLCGAAKRPLDGSPLSGVCWTCWKKVIKLVKASLRKGHVVRGDAMSEGMGKQLRSDRWVTAAVWSVIWLYLIVTHNSGDTGPTPFLAAVGMVIHCALMRHWGF